VRGYVISRESLTKRAKVDGPVCYLWLGVTRRVESNRSERLPLGLWPVLVFAFCFPFGVCCRKKLLLNCPALRPLESFARYLIMTSFLHHFVISVSESYSDFFVA
jgi:hypothetical protein